MLTRHAHTLLPVAIEQSLEGRVGAAIERTLPALRPKIIASIEQGEQLATTFADGGVFLVRPPRAGEVARLERLQALRRRWPHVVIYAVDVDLVDISTAGPPRAQMRLRQAVDAVLASEAVSRTCDVGSLIATRAAAPPPLRELSALAADDALGGWGRWVALFALRNAYGALDAHAVAAHARRSLRTLELDVAQAGLPALGDLIRCGRVLHAVELLRRGVGDSSDRARRLGFADSTVMRQYVWRLKQAARGKVRLQAFVDRLPALREGLTSDAEVEPD